MPSISARFSPASAIASSAALLMRSSEEEPSCLPNAVSPTPVIKLILHTAGLPSPLRGRDERSSLLGVGGGGSHKQSIRGFFPPPPPPPPPRGGEEERRAR